MQIILTIAEFEAATTPFAAEDEVIIRDAAFNLFLLSADKIAQMAAANVDLIDSTDDRFVWNVQQAKAIATTNIGFTAADNVQLFDTTAALQSLTAAEIAALAAKGLDSIRSNSTPNQQIYNASQFKALGGITLHAADKVFVIDTADALATLGVADLSKLDPLDVIHPNDGNPLALSAAQFAVLDARNFAPTDTLVLRDTPTNLSSLSVSDIQALADKGVDRIQSTEGGWILWVAQAAALLDTSIMLTAGDVVTLAGAAVHLRNLIEDRIVQLAVRGVDRIDVIDDEALLLSADAAAALAETSITFAENDQVRLADSGVKLMGLAPEKISLLGARNIDAIDVTDDVLTLSAQQAVALAGTDITLTAADTITVAGNSTDLAALLTVPRLTALAAKGVDILDAEDNVNVFTIETFNALGGIALTASDSNRVQDSGAAFAALTAEQMARFAAKGIDAIVAADGNLSLSLAQVNALGPVELVAGNNVILRDAAGTLQTLTAADIFRLNDKFIDRIDSTDDALTLSVAQAVALVDTEIFLSANDAVTLADTGARLQNLTPDHIGHLSVKGVDVIDATNNALTFSVAQALALIDTEIALSAGDVVTLAGTAADLQDLINNRLAHLDSKGIDVIDVTDGGALTLSAAQAAALAGTGMALSQATSVKHADTASNLQALTAAQIAGLAAKGVDVIDATDNTLTLSVGQARALADTPLMLTADDEITLTATLVELQTLTGAQIAALRAKGVDHFNITNPGNETIYLTIAQLDALAGIDLAGLGDIVLRDTGAALGSLPLERVAQLAGLGIVSVDAGNDILVLSMTQLNALSAIGLTASDTITLLDTSAWLAELTGSQIAAMDSQGVDKINALDDEWTMTIAQAKALAATGMVFAAVDEMT